MEIKVGDRYLYCGRTIIVDSIGPRKILEIISYKNPIIIKYYYADDPTCFFQCNLKEFTLFLTSRRVTRYNEIK